MPRVIATASPVPHTSYSIDIPAVRVRRRKQSAFPAHGTGATARPPVHLATAEATVRAERRARAAPQSLEVCCLPLPHLKHISYGCFPTCTHRLSPRGHSPYSTAVASWLVSNALQCLQRRTNASRIGPCRVPRCDWARIGPVGRQVTQPTTPAAGVLRGIPDASNLGMAACSMTRTT